MRPATWVVLRKPLVRVARGEERGTDRLIGERVEVDQMIMVPSLAAVAR